MSRTRRKPARGTLLTLALILLASGAIRLSGSIGTAYAAGETGSEPAAEPQVPVAVTCPQPPEALARALVERENRASTQEAAIAERLAALDLAEEVIRTRMEEMDQAETALRKTLALADQAAENDLAQLTAVYQEMKPKEAARLFDGMDPTFSAGFLGRMRAPDAAAILSGMAPENAYAVSALIAGRNADVPRSSPGQ